MAGKKSKLYKVKIKVSLIVVGSESDIENILDDFCSREKFHRVRLFVGLKKKQSFGK